MQAAGLCKRAPVSIKKSPNVFEKGQTLQERLSAEHLTDENIVAEFTQLVKALPSKLINKMLSNKPKPKVNRKRDENVASHKKPPLEPVKSEGANAKLRKNIQAKAETVT